MTTKWTRTIYGEFNGISCTFNSELFERASVTFKLYSIIISATVYYYYQTVVRLPTWLPGSHYINEIK